MPAVAKPSAPLVTLVRPVPRKLKVVELEAIKLVVLAVPATVMAVDEA